MYCSSGLNDDQQCTALHSRASKIPAIFISAPQTTPKHQRRRERLWQKMKDIRSFYEKLLSQNILWYFGVSPLCSFLVAAQLVIMDRERGREASTWISFIFLQFTFSSNYLFSNIFSLGFGGVWRPNYVFIHSHVSFKLQQIIAKKNNSFCFVLNLCMQQKSHFVGCVSKFTSKVQKCYDGT